MMFSQKIFKRINTIALFAVVFASLAPSISHAFAAKQDVNGFVQEICSANGVKITIQVLTSQDKQLASGFDSEQKLPANPKTFISHLNHCPFCSNPIVHLGLEPPNTFVFSALGNQSQQYELAVSITNSSFKTLPPPAQAPPIL